ncbi:MAG: HD domain-containing protein [Patescibacteria group bacterium]
MQTIEQIYKDYKIMPGLQLHQLRVASVAKIVCESLPYNVDSDNVVLACLFHDMGNIIKSDLPRFPEFLEPEGIEYWQGVKDEYILKYGPKEHEATIIIAKELGVPDNAFEYLNRIGFSKLTINEKDEHPEFKICSYADMRVGPHGVLSIEQRLADARKRYEGRLHTVNTGEHESLAQSLRNIEKALFADSKIKPEDITDQSIKELMNSLKKHTL